MGNRISSRMNSRLLENKLAVLLERLNSDLKDSATSEREELLIRFNKTIKKFYTTLSNPLFQVEDFRNGTFPNYKKMNEQFYAISQDLAIIYREINALQGFMVNNFNTLNTQSSAVRGRLRRVSSNLGDFRLQAMDNLGGALYFSDNFKNADKIDYTDSLYEKRKNSLDIEAGVTYLPVDTSNTLTHKIEEMSVGSGSNGVAGNNQELGGLLRGSLKHIDDENPDTWFEYETISSSNTSTPLIFELRLKLDKDSILNSVDISPTTFATRNYPRITKFEVSVDGKTFSDIINEVTVSEIFGQSESRVITLSPEAGKFSGVVKLNFPPKKIRYINIIIQQDDAYIIKTSTGLKYRKAIGLRDIALKAIRYLDEGETVSILQSPEGEISKIAVIAHEQTTPGLTKIKHYISPDNGQNWHELQSVEKIGKDIKEILSFNLEDAEGNITTSNPVTGVRYKAKLKREATGFSARGGIEKRRKTKSEFLSAAAGTQSLALINRPIPNSVMISNTSFGSVGGNRSYLVSSSDKIERNDKLYIYLPDTPFFQKSIREDQEIIKIGNEVWRRVTDLSLSTGGDKAYEFDYLNNIITFGDDTNGKKPIEDIYFSLKREQVQISSDAPRKAILTYSTDKIKETTQLYRLEKLKTKNNYVLPKEARVHRTNTTDIEAIDVVADTTSLLAIEKIYLNGSEELTAAGEYSIDYIGGIIYTYSQSSSADDTVININYRPRIRINSIEAEDNNLVIQEEEYIAEAMKSTISISSPTKVIDIPSSFIEPRSLRFVTLSSFFKTEVPYKGDGTEFDIGLAPADLIGYFSIDYKNGTIFTYSLVSGTLVLEYNKTEYYSEYNIGVTVPRSDYVIDEEISTITFSDRYIVNNYSDAIESRLVRTLFRVQYDYITELEQNPRELEAFYTPFLRDYALAILTKEQL